MGEYEYAIGVIIFSSIIFLIIVIMTGKIFPEKNDKPTICERCGDKFEQVGSPWPKVEQYICPGCGNHKERIK